MTLKFTYLLLFLLIPSYCLGQVKIENYSLQKPDTNLLYIGIANKIHLSGIKNASQVKILLNGRYYAAEKNGLFYLLTSSIDSALLQVFLNAKCIASKRFYSNRIPEPIALLDNYRDTLLSKNEIANYDSIRVILPNCLLAYKLTVINYQVTIVSKNKQLNISNKIIGAKIPAKIIDLIKKLEPGDKIIFDEFKVYGPDDMHVDAFSITVK